MSHKKWCPRCNQGWVIPVKITKTGQIVQFCLECEAVWRSNVNELKADRYSEQGEDGTFMSLGPFLETQGIRYNRGCIENACGENEYLWRTRC